MKKLNLKQPKYIFPLIIFLPLAFVAYELTNVFGGSEKTASTVATDSLNLELPLAINDGMEDKMTSMQDRISLDKSYSAVFGLDDDQDGKDSVDAGYTDDELDAIDKADAERQRQAKAIEELQRIVADQNRRQNSYLDDDGYSAGYGDTADGSYSNTSDELEDYERQLQEIQERSLAAQRAITGGYTEDTADSAEVADSDDQAATNSADASAEEKEQKTEIVTKAESRNSEMFNTVTANEVDDTPLIKAMIDKTTKAHEGTRLRFKLLDDVTIDNTLLKKGTYLYGLVTGFGTQRVRASITNILVGNKFLKVNLSVYDNDGMEGFYVPESAFRDLMREAGSQVMQQNMQFNNGYGGYAITGESVALQALQNIYQSASNAVSTNIRKNKARIKYNTIVYLVNTTNER